MTTHHLLREGCEVEGKVEGDFLDGLGGPSYTILA
jgi:hypothetical protein